MDDAAAWRKRVEAEREWRNAHYTADDSPLEPEALARFKGIEWFPVDAAYRVTDARLERHPEPRPAALGATGADALTFVEVGVARFRLHGEDLALKVFQPAPGEVDESFLFIPFRDATSGASTYGGGRYLDMPPVDGDVLEIDFNLAYHPYCVFDDAWSCTLPPPENRLAVPVEAGERLRSA